MTAGRLTLTQYLDPINAIAMTSTMKLRFH